MRYGIFGTGVVGQTLASRLIELGHEVKLSGREAGGAKAKGWVAVNGDNASEGDFSDAAAFGEILVNATAGTHALQVIESAGAANIGSKIIVDVSNPLDASNGFPPSLSVCNTDSVGEQIQRTVPNARVVKSLNTMNAALMVNPAALQGDHTVFINGDDAPAKASVRGMLMSFGWQDKNIVDLGDITASRGAEAYVLIWIRMYGALGAETFNINLVTT